VTRVRIATVLLLVSSLGAAAFLPASSDASGHRRPWTHRITVVTGQLVDHWTLDDSEPCHATGGGTVTLSFHFVKTKRVQLILDPYHGESGSWVVGIPGPTGGIRDMPAQPVAGTLTFADDRTQNPPPEGGDCDPIDKSGCGTFALPRATKASIFGYNRRYLKADFGGGLQPRGNCQVGNLETFTDRLAGGTRYGDLLLRMPTVRAVKHRRSIMVTGASHKRSVYGECGSGNVCTEDVTRHVSVTFKHL
jgi:hypothetical protein